MEQSTISQLTRELNIIHEGDLRAKKEAIVSVFEKFNAHKVEIALPGYEQLFKQHVKIILECFDSPSDAVREHAARIIHLFVSRSRDLHSFIELIYQKLVARTNCTDLEGISNLPEQMRPTRSQKPHVLVNVIEHIEEIRLIYLEIVKDVIESAEEDIVIHYMTETVDLLRVFLMDRELNIQIQACEVLADFITKYKDYLPNFAEIMCQALLLPLVSKKFRVRLAALKALKELLYVGSFKQSVN